MVWEKIDDYRKSIAGEPWSLYWKEFKSGTKVFEEFLHGPLKEIVNVFDGVDSS